MLQVTISQLKNSLSAYLKRAQAGESILILDRDRPIAMLEKVDAIENPDSRLSRLELTGAIRRSPSANPLGALASTQRPPVKDSVVDALLEERREGK